MKEAKGPKTKFCIVGLIWETIKSDKAIMPGYDFSSRTSKLDILSLELLKPLKLPPSLIWTGFKYGFVFFS